MESGVPRVLRGLDTLRSNPALYYPDGVATPAFLLAELCCDALSLGAKRLESRIDGQWAAAAADVDWFALPSDYRCHGVALFEGLHHAPWKNQNAIRAEALVGASSASLWVLTGGTTHQLRGVPCPDMLRELTHTAWAKASVAFSLNAA